MTTKPSNTTETPVVKTVSNGQNGSSSKAAATQPDPIPKSAKESTKTHLQDSKDLKEIGGPKGLEPTRYGDWEAKGRCYDF